MAAHTGQVDPDLQPDVGDDHTSVHSQCINLAYRSGDLKDSRLCVMIVEWSAQHCWESGTDLQLCSMAVGHLALQC